MGARLGGSSAGRVNGGVPTCLPPKVLLLPHLLSPSPSPVCLLFIFVFLLSPRI